MAAVSPEQIGHDLWPWLVLAAVVFGINLLPAFAPPTWSVLVWFRLQHDLAPVPLVLVGVTAAASGRYLLALGARRLGRRLSPERQARLERARERIEGTRGRWALVVLFLVSPLPSAQLFVAAGLTSVNLKPLTAAFAAGRLVTYSLYVGAATAAQARFGDTFTESFRSPYGIAVQIVFLVAAVALPLVDWDQLLHRHKHEPPQPDPAASA